FFSQTLFRVATPESGYGNGPVRSSRAWNKFEAGSVSTLSHRPRDGSVLSSTLHCMNDPQPEGHMASYIGRRKFLATLGGAAAAWPLAARAQQDGRMLRVAVLTPYAESDPLAQTWFEAFVEGMRAVGWIDGRNVRVDVRWAGGAVNQLPRLAKELVDLQPEVVFAMTTPSVNTVQRETHTVPIVFTQVTDPVAQGLIESLDRPGGNITGFTI